MAASKAAESVIALPKPLPFWQATLYRVLLPVCIAGIFVGSIGLLILAGDSWNQSYAHVKQRSVLPSTELMKVYADPEKKYWVSQTKYGEFWRQVTDWNPVTNGVCFNGGILGEVNTESAAAVVRENFGRGISDM